MRRAQGAHRAETRSARDVVLVDRSSSMVGERWLPRPRPSRVRDRGEVAGEMGLRLLPAARRGRSCVWARATEARRAHRSPAANAIRCKRSSERHAEGGTPMSAALDGSISASVSSSRAGPHEGVVILVTDGDPSVCVAAFRRRRIAAAGANPKGDARPCPTRSPSEHGSATFGNLNEIARRRKPARVRRKRGSAEQASSSRRSTPCGSVPWAARMSAAPGAEKGTLDGQRTVSSPPEKKRPGTTSAR